ncbi:MAG: hypothetical protein K2L70_05880 [Clostridia bacterium]|nr:hypothetical protein [Clostridia bacterium]
MKDVAVLDFGSGKLSFIVGVRSVDNCFVVKNYASIEYPGYYGGEWVSVDTLSDDVSEVISQSGFDFRKKTLFVAVPSEFTQIRLSGMVSDLGKKKCINSSILTQIHDKAEGITPSGYTALCSSALEYVLDGELSTVKPIGQYAQNIYAQMSYVFGKDEFIKTVYAIVTNLGFKDVKFVDGIWAEGGQLIDERARVNGAVLIDVGYASTTFALIKGDGIKYKKDKSFGSGFLIDGLASAMGVEYEVAQSMFSQITLNIESDDKSVYRYEIGARRYECKAKDVNNFLHNKILTQLVDFANACISEIKEQDETLSLGSSLTALNKAGSINLMTEFYLTGGGLSSIRGASQFFARALGREVGILTGNMPGWDKPYQASAFATMEVAEKMNRKNSLLEKLFG